MRLMDYKKLQPLSENKNPVNHEIKASDNEVCRQSVDILKENVGEFLLDKTLYECSSLLISENNWFRRRKNTKCLDSVGNELKIYERQILQIDYGKTYKVECGIIHYCVVLKVMDKKLFTIPMTSSEKEFSKSYHPTNNPNGRFDFRQGLTSEGYTANVSLYINDIKCVSKGRILPYDKVNLISEEAFRDLQNHIMAFHFKNAYYDLIDKNKILIEENQKLKTELDAVKNSIDT